MPSRRRLLLATAAALPLGACGWLGQDEGPPLPGVRKSVLMTTPGPVADVAAAGVSIDLPAPNAQPEWPQAFANLAHVTGRAAGTGTLSEAWSTSIGASASSSYPLLGSLVAAQGRIFGVDSEGRVTALDGSSGKEIWSQHISRLGDSDRVAGGAAAYDNGLLFVTYGNGWVVALDANDGKEVWRRQLNSPLRSAPTAAPGNVLVRTADNQLYSLNPTTGELRWRHAGAFEQAGILGGSPAAVLGTTVIVAYSSGEVFALLLDDGRELWTETVLGGRSILALDTITDITAAPVIADGTVYIAGGAGEMAALMLDRGTRVWDNQISSLETPALAGNVLYVITEAGELVCLLRQSGAVRWVQHIATQAGLTKLPSNTSWTGPLLVGDSLIVAGSSGDVLSFSPNDGSFQQHYAGGTPIRQPPIVANGTVYVLDDKSRVTALR
ncbi:PQQ-like domain-containing protein [Arboricoccus pini]|uniref:PQQ-like domain-containing protein n=1 Tax=Arboricoccus pini TaxID=1963835 RepID=A0A212QWU8_9PROT|nr:PQQ-binding-like beta-propeller repeat protein [Arboricoccus pini]SNB64228.1 PQQ-like domain-containing protein [Arboricoccus pini]